MGEIAPIILALATLVSSVVAAWISIRNSRAIKEVHTLTNSMSTALVAASKAQGTAEGKAIGLQQGREEANPKVQDAK